MSALSDNLSCLHFRVLVLNVVHKETAGKDGRLGDVHIPLKDVDFSNPQRTSYDLADLVSSYLALFSSCNL